MKQTTLHFHIGRGGRFHNPGHKSFVGAATLKDVINQKSNQLFYGQDDDGTQGLCDGSGHFIISHEDAKKTTGVLNWDNDFDTDEVIYLHEATGEDIHIVRLSGDYEADELVRQWIELKTEGQPIEWERICLGNYRDIIEDIENFARFDITDYYQPLELKKMN